MLTLRRALFQVALSVFVVGLLALTSPRPARTQDGRAVPADVRVVNPNTAPVFSSIVNTASAPVQAKIVNALGAPVPANIINPATTPVQAKIVNGPASPVQTSLVGSPVVGAKQSGTWSVNVGNPVTSPVRVQEPNRVLVSTAAISQHPDDPQTAIAELPVPTMPGQWLLIEELNYQIVVPSGQGIFTVELFTRSANGGILNFFPFDGLASYNGQTYCAGGRQMRLYHDPNQPLPKFYVLRTSTAGSFYGYVTIHGRFVPAP